MANPNIPTKNAGDQLSSDEFNQVMTALDGKSDRPVSVDITSGLNMVINAGDVTTGLNNIFRIPLAHNGQINNPTGGFDGQRIMIVINYTASVAPTWGNQYRFPDNFPKPTAEQYSGRSGATDKFLFEKDASGKWDCHGIFVNFQ
jgi:hypothetical protein